MTKKITISDLFALRNRGEKIVVLTAYDYTFGRLAETAGADVLLVGDSLASVVQGLDNTLPVTLDEMIYHTRLVARAAERAFVVCDLPFMSYQLGPKEALAASGRAIKEAGAQGVKLEGGKAIAETVRKITEAGIPVMGHVGLKPQSVHQMGGYKVQGRNERDANEILEDAKVLEDAGAFSIVLEGIPSDLAGLITEKLSIPTIGIGAGPSCSGQVLVIHDALGLTQRGEGETLPKFVKEYAQLGDVVESALRDFCEEVRSGDFPSAKYSYRTKAQVLQKPVLRKVESK